jgi:competence protein ComEC
MRHENSGVVRWWRGFCRRHPLFAAAVVTVVCVALADRHAGWGAGAAVALAAVGGVSAGWRFGLSWLSCGLLAVAVFTWRAGSRATAERDMIRAPAGDLRARVLKDARGYDGFWMAPARVLEGDWQGTEIWWQGSGKAPVEGSVVTGRGNFGPLPGPRNPGEFDRAAWLRRQGVAAVFLADRAGGTAETGKWAALGRELRRDFRARVTAGLDEDSLKALVIRAIVIGEQPLDADAVVAAFRNSGTLHAFSVSGLHVAMVGSLGWWVLGLAGVPRRWAVVALLPLVFGYAWITGNSAPAVRSAWMAAVFLGAFAVRRKPDLLNSLGAVLLAAMLWDGRLLFQPGVQLSYGVVAAIAVGTAWAAKTFSWMAVPERYLPERMLGRWQEQWLALRKHTAQSLAVSLAAGLGSAPLTAFHFGLVTPISVLAGVVLVPLVFGLLAAALLSVALSPALPSWSRLVNQVNGGVASVCVWTAEAFAAVPGGHFRTRRATEPMLLLFDLDYGSGAACFSGGDDGAVLIDCGGARGFKSVIAPALRELGIEPDSVVLSHPDGGHLGGGARVWEMFPIRRALLPVERSRSPSFRAWLERAPAAGIRLHQAAATESLAFPDDAVLEILHAPDPLAVNALADERVALFRLHWRGWKLLFTSDAGMGTELKAIASGKDLTADVIIAGRHRSDLTLCDPFLDAVRPQVILTANPPFPVEDQPAPGQMDYWLSRGIRVVDQAVTGGVTLRVDAAGFLRIEGFLSGPPLVLAPR